jgi:preprotein translocase subunit SecF
MDKRKLHHQFKFIKKIRPIYLFVIAVFFLALGIIGIRENYLQMTELREKVFLADEKGKNIEEPLRELREYVFSHMNTDLSSGNVPIKPPIQLNNRYEQLLEQEQNRADKINKDVKEKAERQCAQEFPAAGLNSERVNCVAEYTSDNAVRPREIPSELYKFDFVSPVWSPDFAGLSLLASLFFFATFGLRLLIGLWYRHELK